MPKNHARKQALAELKTELGIKHADAIALLDHPDENEREAMEMYLAEFSDINTYAEAKAFLAVDPRRQLLCDKCGWSVAMVCPECPGCGCYTGQCTGWRHSEFEEEDPEADPWGCPECGAGGSGNPYGECYCYDDDDQAEVEVA